MSHTFKTCRSACRVNSLWHQQFYRKEINVKVKIKQQIRVFYVWPDYWEAGKENMENYIISFEISVISGIKREKFY